MNTTQDLLDITLPLPITKKKEGRLPDHGGNEAIPRSLTAEATLLREN